MSDDRRADPEQARLEESRRTGRTGSSGGPTSASGSGARSARTTARTATPGTTSPTTRPARAPTAGARTAWPASRDDKQRLCFALALWNGRDPILKERLFGLTNSEGNHGEDVKEYYFYLDSTPTHSYMKYLYKYPQAAYPYDDLVDDQRRARASTSRSTSCSTPASSTRTATSTSSSSTPRRPRGYPDPDHGRQPRARRPRRCTCCRRSGSATPGPGAAAAASRELREHPAASVVAAQHTASLAQESLPRLLPVLRGRADAAVHRERDQRPRLSARPTPRPTSRTASTTTSCTASRTRSTPPGAGPRPPRTTRSPSPPARATDRAAAADRASAPGVPRAPFADFDAVSRPAPPGGGRLLRRASRPPAVNRRRRAPASCARRWPACSGASSTIYYDVDTLARGAPLGPADAARRASRRAQRASGST